MDQGLSQSQRNEFHPHDKSKLIIVLFGDLLGAIKKVNPEA